MRLAGFLGIFYLVSGVSMLVAQPSVTAWNILNDDVQNAKSPDHRKQAVAAIAAIGPAPEAVKALEGVLQHDQDPMVRQAAATALGDMKATQSIPALKDALNDDSGEVAFSAAKALWDLGDPTGKETFDEILTQERKSDGMMTSFTNKAKRIMRDPKKMTYLGARAASGAVFGPLGMGFTVADQVSKEKVAGLTGRALAAQYMAKDCDARVVQLLEWALQEDDHWIVKAASAQGIGKCADGQAIPMLEKYLSDSHEPLKYQAAAAIVRLSSKEPPPAPTSATNQSIDRPAAR